MRYTFLVEVEVEGTEGKFASRDEVEQELQTALEESDPGSVGGIGSDGSSSYEVTSWEVSGQAQPRRAPRLRRPVEVH